MPTEALTDDAVLGGRLVLRQPRTGHRVGHDAILLAASTEAADANHAVELGAGVGAAGLALAQRTLRLSVTLVELDPVLGALAEHNAVQNGLVGRVRVAVLDVAGADDAFASNGLRAGSAGCVLMNPPFNDPARQNASPDPRRRLAHAGSGGTLAKWVQRAGWLLAPSGVLTLIWRAEGLGDVLCALGIGGIGGIGVVPVYPRPDAAAIRILVRGIKGSRAPLALAGGLMLNDANGRPTAEAEAILRGGQSLVWPV